MSFQRDFLSKKITDPLAKIVSDLAKQEYQQNFQVQNIDSLNVQVLSIKTKTKTLSKDKFHVSVKSYDSSQRFYNAVYPDRKKLKLWIKGENSDKLNDYALMNHNCHLWSAYQVAEQYTRDDINNMAGYETVSYANGTHYIHVQDRKDLRIKDLIVDEPTSTGFSIIIRFNPLTYGKSAEEPVILSQKVDSSQNRYGHSINVDNKGNIYFYVVYNYRLYWCKLDNPIPIPFSKGDYKYENYNPKNYKTDVDFLTGAIDVSYDLVCQFNYITKECIIKVLHDEVIQSSASNLTGSNAIPSNIQVNLPLQDGKWSETQTLPNNLPMAKCYDSSPNQLTANIMVPDNIVWNDDNTFNHVVGQANGGDIEIPNNSAFNTFTEMTVAFWFKPIGNISLTNRIFLLGYDNTMYFKIHRHTDNSLSFSMSLNSDGSNGTTTSRTNVFSNMNQWYFVVCKWKTGERLSISVNNDTETNTAAAIKTGTFTELTQPFNIYDWRSDNAILINFMFWKRKITATEQTRLFNYGAHLANFPPNLEPQRLMNPAPVPVTNPITTIFDLPPLPTPVWGDGDYIWLNNPSTTSPFTLKYDCPDGVAAAVPVSTVYNIAPGSGGTTVNPFTTIYTLPGVNSTGQIAYSSTASNKEWGYVQYILNSGSVFFGKKLTEITVGLNGLANPTGGLVWLGIIKNDGNVIKFGTSIDPTTIPDAWTNYTRQLTTNSYVMALNDGVGVIWENGTGGSVNVQRGGSDTHADLDTSNNPRSCQNGRRGSGLGEWKTENTQFSMAGVIKIGGDTVGSPPYYALKNVSGSNYLIGEYFPTGSPMLGEKLTHVEYRIYRDSAATNGQVSIRHVKADGTFYPTLMEVNVSTLPTEAAIPTTFNFVWDNVDYGNPILVSERIAVVTNGLTTGNVYVLANIGNSGAGNSYDTTRSYINWRSFAGVWGSNTSIDISGIMKKGGSSFTPYLKFSPSVTRIYERAVNASSIFYDQPISRVIARGKRTGTIPQPSIMTARLRSNANVEKAVIGTFDANSVLTTLGDIQFTNNNQNVKTAVGDYISIEIATCDASNYIELNITNVAYDAGNSINGALTSGVIGDLAGTDLAGKFYIGGQIDNVSRTRCVQYIDTQESILLNVPNNRVTIFEATLCAIGAPTGQVYFNIRRGFDDALIVTIGSVSASSITTALTGTRVHVENFNNTYILGAKDKLSIEYEGGNLSNRIGVQIKADSGYDLENSYIQRYNGVVYDDYHNYDITARLRVGGDTYVPDPNAPPPVLPQNSTDLYLLTNAEKDQLSFMRCIFGMYLFFNTILTDNELINFNYTRIDTGNNSPDTIQVTNHSYFRNS